MALAWLLAKWGALGSCVGLLCGVASAAFLASLAWASATFHAQPWLLWLLPLGGAAVAGLYHAFGQGLEKGNNLILERIHEPNESVPVRLAPLILVATVVTHLFGGSVGREGTAVQMGGALSSLLAKPFKLGRRDRRILLMAGIAGGFGSVFGTPLAGAVFAMEVLTIGHLDYEALVPCLLAGFVGDVVCQGLGIHHASYRTEIGLVPAITFPLFFWLLLAGGLFGLASLGFSELTHWIGRWLRRVTEVSWMRQALGGLGVIGLTLMAGSRDYNGLSLGLIETSFIGKVVLYAFAVKLVFTAVSLGSGMKGGEVTPLFCIGATLGNGYAQVVGHSPPYFAALGFAAVFGAAANTPLACTILGIELFGAELAMPLAITCVVAYIVSGHRGIYPSQRLGRTKSPHISTEGKTLDEVREHGLAVGMPWLKKIARKS